MAATLNPSNPAVSVNRVVKTYSTPGGTLTVLDGIDFQLARGAMMAVVGPSGSGKSTLLHVIGGLDPADSGAIEVDGTAVHSATDRERTRLRAQSVGMVFQSHHLLPQCTAWENALVPTMAASAKVRKEPVDVRLKRLFQRVGLEDRLDHLPSRLSGGECQRVALVRALANEPALLLADEPTGALDKASADRLTDLLLEINASEGVALLVITHSEELARRIGNVHRMENGRLVPQLPS
jgi:lipoprotein-releasing system ATP-binding protein